MKDLDLAPIEQRLDNADPQIATRQSLDVYMFYVRLDESQLLAEVKRLREERDEMLRDVRMWIASFAGASVGADEMLDRISDCIAAGEAKP